MQAHDRRSWDEAQDFIGLTAAAIDAARERIEAATALVKGA